MNLRKLIVQALRTKWRAACKVVESNPYFSVDNAAATIDAINNGTHIFYPALAEAIKIELTAQEEYVNATSQGRS